MLSLKTILELTEKGETRVDVDLTPRSYPVLRSYKMGDGVGVSLRYEEDLVSGDVRIVQD
ncbi:hypothetical protein HOD75_02700 [archaeon]|jgi:hypothetical protein|nr:hypothetical protein [archaeon]MBT4241784.1 hypothetical protein [archaeon]MBT4418332.1 hypothetical protein [archaeon]